MYHAWLSARSCRFRVQVLPSLRIEFSNYKFGSTLSWIANWLSAQPWIDFLAKPFMGAWREHFPWRDVPFLLNFCLFLTRNAKNIEKKWSYPSYLDSPHSNSRFQYPSLFSIWEKICGTWQTLLSHSFGPDLGFLSWFSQEVYFIGRRWLRNPEWDWVHLQVGFIF